MLRYGTTSTTTKRWTHFATGMFAFCGIAVNNRFELGICKHIFPILTGRNAQKDKIKGK